MKTKEVTVAPYNADWALEFEKIRCELLDVLGNDIIGIEHVGSTSVEGLSAKPIIDIDVIIKDYGVFNTVKSKLGTVGYFHEENLGIQGREAFTYEGKPHLMKHHLYVCPQNSAELKRHIVFRDYLRKHPGDREEYSRVKQRAALHYPKDIDAYIAEKSPCIEAIYRKCGL